MSALQRRATIGWGWIFVVPLAAVAVMATVRLVEVVRYLVGVDAAAVGLVALVGVPAGAVAVLVARRAPVDRPSWPGIAAAGLLFAGLRIVAAVAAPAPIISDWERYHRIAVDIAANGPRFDIVPTGFPTLLGAVYAVFGSEPAVGRAVQVVIGLGIGALVYLIASRGWNHRVALVALVLVALAPSQILIGTVLASEPLYTLLLLGAVAALIGPPSVGRWIAIGALLGASAYVRATSVALLPLLAWLAWRTAGTDRSWRAPAVIVATFVLVLVPVIAWNWATLGSPSVSTSRVGNFSLMVGLNQETGGRWSQADLDLVGGVYGTPESERIAADVALERLTGDPAGSIGLMVAKFASWGREDYGAYWAIGVVDDGPAWRVTSLASQAWWAVITALATLAAMRYGGRHRVVAATGLIVIGVTVVHALLETQGRYHSYVVPLLAILAAAVLGEFGRSGSEEALAE